MPRAKGQPRSLRLVLCNEPGEHGGSVVVGERQRRDECDGPGDRVEPIAGFGAKCGATVNVVSRNPSWDGS